LSSWGVENWKNFVQFCTTTLGTLLGFKTVPVQN
jgi:hypothetical protein